MSRLSLPQLEAFLWIARLRSFRAAAERLNVTQPTISLRIRDLESELGVKLFERRGESTRLTADGSVMLTYVEQGLDTLDAMRERLRTRDPLRGVLRLGTSDMFAMTYLPRIVEELETRYPQLRIELRVANSVLLAEGLNANQLDLAFLVDPDVLGHVSVEPLIRQEVAWMSSPARRLDAPLLRARDLVGVSILTSPPQSPLNNLIVRWFAAERLPTPTLSTCNNIAVTARLVARGVAMSALPTAAVRAELRSGQLIRYAQRTPFKPMTLCAAYQASARGAGIDTVVRIARTVIDAEDANLQE